MKDNDGWVIVFAALGLIALVLIMPLVYFVLGAFVGWILSSVLVFAGNWLIEGMSLLHVELTLAQLPLFCGTLAFLGAYFVKSSNVSSKK